MDAGFLEIANQLAIFAFALIRMLAVFAMLPIVQASVLPGNIRTAFAISLTLVVFPVLGTDIDVLGLGITTLISLVAKEVAIGILIGFGASTIFYALESAGFFIDNQRGSSMASSVDPLTGSQTSPLGIFLTQVVTVYVFSTGGFLLLLSAVYQSYLIMPVFEFYPSFDIEDARAFLRILDRIVMLGIVIAAPAMIAMFLSEFGLGLVSRFAPQLNVFFLAMPVKSAVGILMLTLYIGLLPLLWESEIANILLHVDLLGSILQ